MNRLLRWCTRYRLSYLDGVAVATTATVAQKHGITWAVAALIVLVSVSVLADLYVAGLDR